MAIPRTKICPKCRAAKSLSSFPRVISGLHKGMVRGKCHVCLKEYYRDRRKKWREEPANRKKACAVNRRHKYGVSDEWYAEECLKGCAICGKKKHQTGQRALHVDHDHNTGRVRGVLCAGCNRGLGLLGDSIESIRLVIRYLDKGPKGKGILLEE